jgi:hypothetical protein
VPRSPPTGPGPLSPPLRQETPRKILQAEDREVGPGGLRAPGVNALPVRDGNGVSVNSAASSDVRRRARSMKVTSRQLGCQLPDSQTPPSVHSPEQHAEPSVHAAPAGLHQEVPPPSAHPSPTHGVSVPPSQY